MSFEIFVIYSDTARFSTLITELQIYQKIFVEKAGEEFGDKQFCNKLYEFYSNVHFLPQKQDLNHNTNTSFKTTSFKAQILQIVENFLLVENENSEKNSTNNSNSRNFRLKDAILVEELESFNLNVVSNHQATGNNASNNASSSTIHKDYNKFVRSCCNYSTSSGGRSSTNNCSSNDKIIVAILYPNKDLLIETNYTRITCMMLPFYTDNEEHVHCYYSSGSTKDTGNTKVNGIIANGIPNPFSSIAAYSAYNFGSTTKSPPSKSPLLLSMIRKTDLVEKILWSDPDLRHNIITPMYHDSYSHFLISHYHFWKDRFYRNLYRNRDGGKSSFITNYYILVSNIVSSSSNSCDYYSSHYLDQLEDLLKGIKVGYNIYIDIALYACLRVLLMSPIIESQSRLGIILSKYSSLYETMNRSLETNLQNGSYRSNLQNGTHSRGSNADTNRNRNNYNGRGSCGVRKNDRPERDDEISQTWMAWYFSIPAERWNCSASSKGTETEEGDSTSPRAGGKEGGVEKDGKERNGSDNASNPNSGGNASDPNSDIDPSTLTPFQRIQHRFQKTFLGGHITGRVVANGILPFDMKERLYTGLQEMWDSRITWYLGVLLCSIGMIATGRTPLPAITHEDSHYDEYEEEYEGE